MRQVCKVARVLLKKRGPNRRLKKSINDTLAALSSPYNYLRGLFHDITVNCLAEKVVRGYSRC